MILIDSVFRTGKNYYPQVFLEECKYVVKEKKRIPKCIIDDTEISSDSDKEKSDEENSYEEKSDEEIFEKIQIKKKILMKKILVKKILGKKILMKKINFFSTYRNITKNYLTIEEIII